MGSTIEKNVFFNHEEIKGEIYIDNSNCAQRCPRVVYYLDSNLWLRGGDADQYLEHVGNRLIDVTIQGPNEHQGDWKSEICLDLKNVPMPDLIETKWDKRRHFEKPISPEDLFTARGVQSRCHAKFFNHEYHFNAFMIYDEGCVCIEAPCIAQEICILPVVNPYSFGFKPPVDWTPTSLGSLKPEAKHLQ